MMADFIASVTAEWQVVCPSRLASSPEKGLHISSLSASWAFSYGPSRTENKMLILILALLPLLCFLFLLA